MAQKTTSSTQTAGPWTYIFLNKPDTKYIDFIRFKDPNKTQTGRVGIYDSPLECTPGPIDTVRAVASSEPNKDIDIWLYYVGDDKTICELKLINADSDDTDPARGWVAASKDNPDMIFENMPPGNRLVDSNVFLSASVKDKNTVVVFRAAGRKAIISYASVTNGRFAVTTLGMPED